MNNSKLNSSGVATLIVEVPPQFALLASGITQLGLEVTAIQFAQLVSYAQLLLKWNKVYKLTAITAPQEVIIQHLLDGLSVVKYFAKHQPILDVGSGMGVPGIILALMYPHSTVVVLDSNSKKSAFLRQVKIELNLTNLQVVTERVEHYQPDEPFALITARAFANIGRLIELAAHLLAPDGAFLAMKSAQGVAESAEFGGWTSQAYKLTVPYLAAPRFLIKMTRK